VCLAQCISGVCVVPVMAPEIWCGVVVVSGLGGNPAAQEPLSGESLQAPPAGGVGSYALPVSGGAWEAAY
jgi:hypothetical protein